MPNDRQKYLPQKAASAKAEAFVTYGAVLVIHDGMAAQSMHAHRPFELIAAIDGPFHYKIRDDDVREGTALLVPPMVRHVLYRYIGRIARIYLDPELRRVTATEALEMKDPQLSSRVRSFVESGRSLDDAKALIAFWRTSWAGSLDDATSCDPRVVQALNVLNDRIIPVADRFTVARLVGLSPSRLAAIFVEQTGVPLLRYIAWRRLLLACRLIREGCTVAQAAVEAGFSDHAHLSRTYRATFGSSPSDLQMMTVVPPPGKR